MKINWVHATDTEQRLEADTGRLSIENMKKPVIEMCVGKSKLEEFKGSVFFEFDPARCKFSECSVQKQKEYGRTHLPWLTYKSAD